MSSLSMCVYVSVIVVVILLVSNILVIDVSVCMQTPKMETELMSRRVLGGKELCVCVYVSICVCVGVQVSSLCMYVYVCEGSHSVIRICVHSFVSSS